MKWNSWQYLVLGGLTLLVNGWTLPVGAQTVAVRSSAIPFGFQLNVPPNKLPEDLDEAARIGAAWVRLTGQTGLDWGQIEYSPGLYNWKIVDRCVKAACDRRLNVVMTVHAANRIYGAKSGHLPKKLNAFTRFLSKAVERYDGDGTSDAKGSPGVRVWQIETELDYPGNWSGSPGGYVTLLKASSQAIKEANPRAKVAVAGMMGPAGLDLYGKILKRLDHGTDFDIFDLHWNNTGGGSYHVQRWWHAGHVRFDKYFSLAQDMLDSKQDRTVETWITEASTSDTANPNDDQRTQAAELIYRHVYALRKGVGTVFWTHVRDHDGSRDPRDYFNHTALIDAAGHKKISYYTYRLMTEKLAGCNQNNLEVVAEDANLFACKFNRKVGNSSRPIWILWNVGLGTRKFSFKLDSTAMAQVTEAIPHAGLRRGSEIRNPDRAFTVTRHRQTGGALSLELKPGIPVYIELIK